MGKNSFVWNPPFETSKPIGVSLYSHHSETSYLFIYLINEARLKAKVNCLSSPAPRARFD